MGTNPKQSAPPIKEFPAEIPTVPFDSVDARLVKRVWESLRRNKEYVHDCLWVQEARTKKEKWNREHLFSSKWGLWQFDTNRSFKDLVAGSDSLEIDDAGPFGFVHARLAGYFEVGPDPHVQCKELEEFWSLIIPPMSAMKKAGLLRPKVEIAQLPTTPKKQLPAAESYWPRYLSFKVDIEANPIKVLGKILMTMRIAREHRAEFGFSPYTARVQQRLRKLSQTLDSYVDIPHFDGQSDDEAFMVWDLMKAGTRRDEIAHTIWPRQYKHGLSEPGGKLMQRITDYKKRVDDWIEQVPRLIRHPSFWIPPKK